MARKAPNRALYLHVFRVEEGLGNALLLGLPDGDWAIVDWGTQADEPLEAAMKLATGSRVRFVAASHAHADHTLGIERLLHGLGEAGIPVERFVYPASTLHRANAHLTKARIAARELKIPQSSIGVHNFDDPTSPHRAPCLAVGKARDWEIRVLSPSVEAIADEEIRSLAQEEVPGNKTSLVLLFRFAGAPDEEGLGRALLPGDATPATLRYARDMSRGAKELHLKHQALVVPHHGSRHNLPRWFVPYVRGVAAISAPTDSARHPAPQVLEQLSTRRIPDGQGAGSKLFCTSYADCCRRKFAHRASAGEHSLVRPGRCFGNLVIELTRGQPARVVAAQTEGELRRRFGYCGNVTASESRQRL